jgi:hypothetical protein
MIRRRPIARAAVVGGVAYSASKHGAAAGEQQAAEQAAAPAPPPAPTGGISEAAMQQLKELAALHESGVLTDEEFETQKAKLLGG